MTAHRHVSSRRLSTPTYDVCRCGARRPFGYGRGWEAGLESATKENTTPGARPMSDVRRRNTPLNLRLEPADVEAIKAGAKAEGISGAEFVLRACRARLEDQPRLLGLLAQAQALPESKSGPNPIPPGPPEGL